jgi:nocturnin
MSTPILTRSFIELSDTPASLTVMQWNILADSLAIDFPAVDERYLNWDHRRRLILDEIDRVNADILCVEELDHFEDFLLPHMQEKEFDGIYNKKPDWHKDGTAIFYRTEILELLEHHIIKFPEGNQFGLYARMRMVKENLEFVVVATHLKSKKDFEARRVEETEVILNYLTKDPNLPIIICGDFNSEPTWETYHHLTSSPLNLHSAYFNTVSPDIEPIYTTYKYRRSLESRVIDYIWLKGFKASSVLSIPTPEEIGPNALPSENYPSDHLSLACKLYLD